MSNTDSFIEEVTEEVRRDALYKMLRRYGWIAALVILLIIGGVAWLELRKSQERAAAEALGDAMLAALAEQDDSARVAALDAISAETPDATAVLRLITAAEQSQADDPAAAIATLDALAADPAIPAMLQQIAQFKSLTLQAGTTDAADRRVAFEAMAQPGNPLRLLASEQLALIDIETGAPEAALARLQEILQDAQVTEGLQQRALQVIVALGGTPDLGALAAGAGALPNTEN